MNKRTLVVDQLYNLAAGFLYALSICYFARGSDFAPGGISGLALIVNYLWHLPVGITTLVFNLPLHAGLFQRRHGFPHHVHQGAAAPPLHRGGHGRH